MAYDGAGWDETIPTNATIANEIDDVARDMKIAVRSRMAVEHVWPSSQSATSSAGYHTYVSLSGQTGTPSLPVAGTAGTQAGLLWSGTDGSLNYVHSSGSSVVIVNSAGSVPTSYGTLSANYFIADSVATGPVTTADQGGFYVKNTGTQVEAFFRTESTGSETQLTSLGLVNHGITVNTGTVSHGGTIPLPSGYTTGECSWMVSMNESLVTSEVKYEQDSCGINCSVSTSRVVTAQCKNQVGNTDNGTANYIIIGVKTA